MTEKQQRRFYFPAWSECSKAMGWVMRKGRLQADLTTLRSSLATKWPAPARDVALQVLDYAYQLAGEEHRGVVAEDLRHGCNLVATKGLKSSSSDFTNKDVDKVVTLFRLLANPENIEAVIAWSAYEDGEDPGSVKRIRYFIEHAAPEAYVRQVAMDRFGTKEWNRLALEQIRELAMTLANRKVSWNKPVAVAAGHDHQVDEPF